MLVGAAAKKPRSPFRRLQWPIARGHAIVAAMERKLAIGFVGAMALFVVADTVYAVVLALRGGAGSLLPYGVAIAVAAIAGFLTYQRAVKPGSQPPAER
jgi:hypothetical protein